MDIKQLSYFVEIYRCRSFTQTAKNCYLTPQGVSISMSRLEEELGVKLFERLPHGVRATAAADFLYPRAEKIISLCSECEEHFKSSRIDEESLSLMFVRGTVERFARGAIDAFRELYPNVSITLHVGTDRECEAAVQSGMASIGMCAGPVDKELSAKLVYRGKNVLIVSREHPLYGRGSVRVQELDKLHLALQERTTNSTNTLLSMCRRAGVRPRCTFVDEPRSAVIMAEIGMCCGVTNNISAEKLCTQDLRMVPFADTEMDWNVYCIQRKNMVLPGPARAFRALLCGGTKRMAVPSLPGNTGGAEGGSPDRTK